MITQTHTHIHPEPATSIPPPLVSTEIERTVGTSPLPGLSLTFRFLPASSSPEEHSGHSLREPEVLAERGRPGRRGGARRAHADHPEERADRPRPGPRGRSHRRQNERLVSLPLPLPMLALQVLKIAHSVLRPPHVSQRAAAQSTAHSS